MTRTLAALWCLAALPCAAQTGDTSAHPSQPPRPLRAGVFTTTQAQSGEAIFRRICSDCHAVPQFQDSAFLKTWSGRTARDLFEMIRTQMPQDNPGSLKREEYVAVVAYIFQVNGFPPGETPLASDDTLLRRVLIERRP